MLLPRLAARRRPRWRRRRRPGARPRCTVTRWPRRRWRWPCSTPSCAPPAGRSPTSSASPATASRAASASASTTRSTSCSPPCSGYVDDGYVRIKLKIEPGNDIEPVAAVRDLIGPDMPFQVDANTAYTAHATPPTSRRLDEFDLLLIEQPLPEEDIARPRPSSRPRWRRRSASTSRSSRRPSPPTPSSSARARSSTSSPAVSVATSRPGGSTTCASQRGIPVWCGGMLETGIGRAANAALAGLPGFTLPGDISASSRFYARDIVIEPIDDRRRPRHRADRSGARFRARRGRPRRRHHDVDR